MAFCRREMKVSRRDVAYRDALFVIEIGNIYLIFQAGIDAIPPGGD